LQNDEDDLRILDSLPLAIKPKGLTQKIISSTQNQLSAKQTNEKEKQETEAAVHSVVGPLGRFIEKIVVFGFNTNSIPAITNLTYFMNQAFFMRKNKKHSQAEEIDFQIGMLLITTKRATQAAEYFRRLQSSLLKKISRNLTKLDKHQGSECSSNNATFLLESELRS